MLAVLLLAALPACHPSTAALRPTSGGDLVIAAEEEPGCADLIGTCNAGSEWAYWILGAETLPRAFDVLPDGSYVPSAVLDGEPVVLAGPPVTITYRIRGGAVWSDGVPITSEDFKYTWREITSGPAVFDPTGYDQVASIDVSDPAVAIVTLKRPFGGYRDLFSAFGGLLPSHLLEGRDRVAAMRDGYTWSAGPWKLSRWDRGRQLVLVPNAAYWGPRPHLSSVTFRFITDPSAEIAALAGGQVDGGYPQPQPALLDGLRGASQLSTVVHDGLAFEAIWLNVEHGILRDVSVRQALAYATDRDAINHQLVQVVDPHAAVLQSTITPANHPDASTPFSRYAYNPAHAAQLMRADGWTKELDGVWAKAGQRAALVFRTTSGNPARLLVQQLLASDWRAAGFDVTLKDEDSAMLFDASLPKGDFDAATFTFSTTPDRSQCALWCSDQIPSVTNHFSGQNYARLSSPVIDADWAAVDGEMDATSRAVDIKGAEADLAEQLPVIPLYARETALVMRKSVHGPITDDFVLGPFWNMEQWWLVPSKPK